MTDDLGAAISRGIGASLRDQVPAQDRLPDSDVMAPAYYDLPGLDGLQAIDVIRSVLGREGFVAYCRGNVLKYAVRDGRKTGSDADRRKALNYALGAAGIDWRTGAPWVWPIQVTL